MVEKENTQERISPEEDISDDDIYAAMKDVPGYLDITPGDLKVLFRLAYRHALRRISSSVRARDIMTRAVHSVTVDAPLKDVADLMAEKNVSGVPVRDGSGNVVGLISEKDFLLHMGARVPIHAMGVIAACLKGKGCAATPVRSAQAKDIMSSPAITVTEETTLLEIMALFGGKNINRVPVVDASNKIKGIVSRADVMRAGLPGGRKK
jgi:CBS-domain-containing membrane protein